MSSEDEFGRLKLLVFRTLENNGVLGQIRTQIRHNVYKTIDQDEVSLVKPQLSEPTTAATLVFDWLEKNGYARSANLLQHEAHMRPADEEAITKARSELQLPTTTAYAAPDKPLLEALLIDSNKTKAAAAATSASLAPTPKGALFNPPARGQQLEPMADTLGSGGGAAFVPKPESRLSDNDKPASGSASPASPQDQIVPPPGAATSTSSTSIPKPPTSSLGGGNNNLSSTSSSRSGGLLGDLPPLGGGGGLGGSNSKHIGDLPPLAGMLGGSGAAAAGARGGADPMMGMTASSGGAKLSPDDALLSHFDKKLDSIQQASGLTKPATSTTAPAAGGAAASTAPLPASTSASDRFSTTRLEKKEEVEDEIMSEIEESISAGGLSDGDEYEEDFVGETKTLESGGIGGAGATGADFSVDSAELEKYDHMEDIGGD